MNSVNYPRLQPGVVDYQQLDRIAAGLLPGEEVSVEEQPAAVSLEEIIALFEIAERAPKTRAEGLWLDALRRRILPEPQTGTPAQAPKED